MSLRQVIYHQITPGSFRRSLKDQDITSQSDLSRRAICGQPGGRPERENLLIQLPGPPRGSGAATYGEWQVS